MNLPTLIVLLLVAAALYLALRPFLRGKRKFTDCGCGRGSQCRGCSGCSGYDLDSRDNRRCHPQNGPKMRMESEKNGRHPHQTA